MFVKYQTVRNLGVVATAAIAGGLGFLLMRGGEDAVGPPPPPTATSDLAAGSDRVSAGSFDSAGGEPEIPASTHVSSSEAEIDASGADAKSFSIPLLSSTEEETGVNDAAEPASATVDEALKRYRTAMQIATKVAVGGKGKDVLGPASPWKLNLYDDNQDGQWDRGKLDYDRDEVDDEKWTFKKGRWEKDGGATIWDGENWIADSTAKRHQAQSSEPDSVSVDPKLSRYRASMRIAEGRAASSGKGKDVLGSSSPWKLNLYDDDKDGKWDRGKLDFDRDDVDDEKWNFKQGRWEKDGGKMIWNGTNWIPSGKY